MKTLSIQKEHLPIRCEVCHQIDMFDRVNNICQRCVGIKLPNKNNLTKSVLELMVPFANTENTTLEVSAYLILFLSVILSIYYQHDDAWAMPVIVVLFNIILINFGFFRIDVNYKKRKIRVLFINLLALIFTFLVTNGRFLF